MKHWSSASVPLFTLGLVLASCTVRQKTEERPLEPGTATLLGSIKNVSGSPVAHAVVSVGDIEVEANESGWFALSELPAQDRALIKITAEGMVPTQRVIELNDGGRTFLDARMFSKAAAVKLDPETGGSVTSGRAKVTFAPDMLRTSKGDSPSGKVNVSLTTIDPTSREQRLATPGDFTGLIDGRGDVQELESFGMVYLSVTDSDAEELVFARGSSAEVSIPVPNLVGAPLTTSPLWTYDEDSGRWVSSGDATYDSTSRTYRASIDSPTYWNADQPYATACWHGAVVTPEGVPAPAGIKVAAEGVNYLGESIAWTDDAGHFAVRVMASTKQRLATARIYAEGTGRYAELAATQTPMELAGKGDCVDIGEVKLAFPLASVVLMWGKSPNDLDSHFTGPDGTTARFHVSFNNRNVPGAFLDTDDTSSFGPEVTSLLKATPGTYVYSIHNFSGEDDGPIEESEAQVIAVFPGEQRTFGVRDADFSETLGTSSVWRVFQFDIDDEGNISELQPLEQVVTNTVAAFEPEL